MSVGKTEERMKISALLAIMFSAGLFCAANAAAQNVLDAPLGTTFQTAAKFGSKQIPLPAGEWSLLAREVTRSPASATAASIPTLRAYLVQFKGGTLDRWIYAASNTEVGSHGWSRDRSVCDRNDVHFGASDANYNARDTECWIVNHEVFTRSNNPADIHNIFYDKTHDKGRPMAAIVAHYYLVKGPNYLGVKYYSNPENADFERASGSWRANSWHRDLAAQDPKKVAYIAKLKSEGESLLPLLKRGLDGRL
jgi:hypothetical protein